MLVQLGRGEAFMQNVNVQGHLVERNVSREISLRDVRAGAKQHGVPAVHPRSRNVHVLPAFRHVGHQRPQVDEPALKCLVGAGAGFYPFQVQTGSIRGLI